METAEFRTFALTGFDSSVIFCHVAYVALSGRLRAVGWNGPTRPYKPASTPFSVKWRSGGSYGHLNEIDMYTRCVLMRVTCVRNHADYDEDESASSCACTFSRCFCNALFRFYSLSSHRFRFSLVSRSFSSLAASWP
eukprot:COSAG01_NODE_30462_length_615_cov_1.403101_1_plen_136_part_01